jgi:hypothetical protein
MALPLGQLVETISLDGSRLNASLAEGLEQQSQPSVAAVGHIQDLSHGLRRRLQPGPDRVKTQQGDGAATGH